MRQLIARNSVGTGRHGYSRAALGKPGVGVGHTATDASGNVAGVGDVYAQTKLVTC